MVTALKTTIQLQFERDIVPGYISINRMILSLAVDIGSLRCIEHNVQCFFVEHIVIIVGTESKNEKAYRNNITTESIYLLCALPVGYWSGRWVNILL